MRLPDHLDVLRVRRRTKSAAERSAHSQCLAELLAQANQRILWRKLGDDLRLADGCDVARKLRAIEKSAAALDSVDHRVLHGEVLKQRDDVGKRFVKRRRIDTGRLREFRSHAVENGMRHFMRDDVVGQAGEDGLTRKAAAGIRSGSRKIPEQDGPEARVIERVRLLERVREDPQRRIGNTAPPSPFGL